MTRFLCTSVLSFLFVATVACGSTVKSEVVNANCPIGGDAIVADGGTTVWKGHTVGFCCESCKPQFEALSDAEKKAALEAAGTSVED